MKKTILLIIISCFTTFFVIAQVRNAAAISTATAPQDTLPSVVLYKIDGDSVRFSSRLRPLRQLAGAPNAFWTYFWDFGDGAFSFLENPSHQYADTGLYYVRLYATNYFDDGQAPGAKPYAVKIAKKPAGIAKWSPDFFSLQDKSIKLKVNNEDHRPGEDFVVLMGYRNKFADTLEGSLVFFFNEKQYKQNLFALADKRTYGGEQNSSLNAVLAQVKQTRLNRQLYDGIDENSIGQQAKSRQRLLPVNIAEVNNTMASDEMEYEKYEDKRYFDNTSSASEILKTLKEKYSESSVVSFKNLKYGQQKFMLMTLNTLPAAVLQDSNATITISAVLVPKDPRLKPEQFDLDMQIAASHDPNRLLLKPHYVNYRFLGKKKQITYKVEFENLGKGPAKTITVDVSMPKQMNMSTLQIQGLRPQCTWCDSAYNRQSCIDTIHTADGIRFVYRNIYLPGMQQNLVTNKDSTKGFIEYSLNFTKRPKKKLPFYSRASIIFDNNKPIITNKATTRFLPGLSPGIIAGYDLSLSNGNYSARRPVKIGFTISPYAASKPYFQFELFTGLFEQEKNTTVYPDSIPQYSQPLNAFITDTEIIVTSKRNFIELVPLHFRYNINNWLAAGVGVMGKVLISEEQTVENILHAFYESPNGNRDTLFAMKQGTKTNSRGFWDGSNIATFVDVQAGMVKTTGPALGLRYIRQWRGNINNHFFLYATFKL